MRIYEDVFEAIRHLESTSLILNLKDRNGYILKRNLSYEAFGMPNGKCSILPSIGTGSVYYRGENEVYPTCSPGIFRGNPSDDEIIIDRLKMIDFMLIVKDFPQIRYAEKDGLDVHFDALAQHYELNTNLLDATSDIAVAAFFATNTYNKDQKTYMPVSKGEGCIRLVLPKIEDGSKNNKASKYIGLQPFKRPGLQCAFGLIIDIDDDSINRNGKVIFKQNIINSLKINALFLNGKINTLFPPEEIADVAEEIKKTDSITNKAINIYCEENGANLDELTRIIETQLIGGKQYKIIQEPIYKLTRQRRRSLEREFKGRPYGDVCITSRLTYLSPK
jgi:hypothetical protein